MNGLATVHIEIEEEEEHVLVRLLKAVDCIMPGEEVLVSEMCFYGHCWWEQVGGILTFGLDEVEVVRQKDEEKESL